MLIIYVWWAADYMTSDVLAIPTFEKVIADIPGSVRDGVVVDIPDNFFPFLSGSGAGEDADEVS